MCSAVAVTGLFIGGVVLPVGSANAAPTKAVSSSPLATQLAVLRTPGASIRGPFGFSVAISGTTAVVGRPDGGYGEGKAYIYVKGPAGWPTTPTVTLHDPAATAGDFFGGSMAMSRQMIVVIGAPGTNGSAGAAYIYVKGGTGWPASPTATLQDPAASAHDSFGNSIAVWGDTVIVGAPFTRKYVGAAYIYVLGAAGWPTTPTVTLQDPAANTYDARFGWSVAVSVNTAVVGAIGSKEMGIGPSSGAAWTYPKGAAGWPTSPTANLYPVSQSGAVFGYSLAMSATTVMVGEPGTLLPVVWIYHKGGSGWHTSPNVLGRSVAISGTTAIVGLYGSIWRGHESADIYRV
jgi:hypothetical protein